jgi:WD40 repeat protein
VKLWDITTGALQRTFSGHRGPVNSVRFTPDGSQLISASSDSTIREWTIGTGSSRVLRGHTGAVNGVAVSGDGKWIFSAGIDGLLNAWNRERGEIIYSYRDEVSGGAGGFTSVSVDPQLRSIATTSTDGSVILWKQVGTFVPLTIPSFIDPLLASYHVAGYPNPVNNQARVEFTLPIAGECSLSIIDALGNEVLQLLNDRLPAGTHSRAWNADRLPNGIYYYRLVCGDVVATSGMMTVVR